MPVKVGRKTYKSHGTAVGALKRRKGKKRIVKPDAYIATIERNQRKGRRRK